MKVISFIMALTLLPSAIWLTDFEQATQIAKEKNQPILLNFSGSDWCGPCIKMKREVFDTPEFQDFAESNLVLVKADFPRQKKNQPDPKQKNHNEALAGKYNPNGKFPLTILLDQDGKVLREWDGYSDLSVSAFINDIRSHGK
jgi:thioredoxin-related protein